MGRHRTSTRLAVAALTVTALTACGSTVQSSTSLPSGQQADGLSTSGGGEVSLSPTSAPPAADSTTSGSAGGTTGTTGTGTTGTTTGGSGGTTGSTGAAGGPPAPPLASQAATGLGVTATTITVGISYTQNGNTANAALGASGITSGDEVADSKAVIDEINAHGGVAGRKLVGVFHPYDATSTSTGDSQDAAACSDYTQDHKVLAVLSGGLTDGFAACLTKAGVVFFRSGVIVGEDRQFLRQHPNEFLLGTMTQDRYLRDLVTSFQRQKYFGAWDTISGKPGRAAVKTAVISYDPLSFTRAVRGTLLPALQAAGHPVASNHVFFIHKPESQSDVGGSTAQIKSATLRMQQDGITHLVFNDASGLLMGLFASNAGTQSYFPRYGLTSGAGAQAIHDSGLVTSAQLNGMSGNGWLPSIDLPATASNAYATPETKRCLQIIKTRTGQTFTSTNAASIALIACDNLFLLQKALSKAASLTPQGLVSALEATGSSFASPFLPATFLSPAQHDDAVRAWDMSWHTDCSCIRYSSQRSVP